VIFPIIVLVALVCVPGWGQDQSWNHVAKLSPGNPIQVRQKDGHTVDGKFQSLSPESLTLEKRNQVRSLDLVSIKQVLVRRKASRWKAAGIGAAVGFGIGFPIGAASAGYLTDRNSPKFSQRAGVGASLGLFGAGIGTGIGALIGGARYETIYRTK
jgi:hypothetical protein